MTTPFTVWFTGAPGSGKTTLAKLLTHHLRLQGTACATLDGAEIRARTKELLGFNASARRVHVVYCAVAAAVLNEAGVCAAAAFVSPLLLSRIQAREIVGDRFFEVYLTCDPGIAKARCPNPEWRGVHVPYEESEAPELSLDTTHETPKESLMKVLTALREQGF